MARFWTSARNGSFLPVKLFLRMNRSKCWRYVTVASEKSRSGGAKDPEDRCRPLSMTMACFFHVAPVDGAAAEKMQMVPRFWQRLHGRSPEHCRHAWSVRVMGLAARLVAVAHGTLEWLAAHCVHRER